MTVRERYENLQSILVHAGETGCLFLSLLSIAEEYNQDSIDLVDAIRVGQARRYIGQDFTCYDQCELLHYLTGAKWQRVIMKELPSTIPDNMYTIAKYQKGFKTHFRRRGWDVYFNSKTARDGKISEYYCYIVEA